MKSLPEASRLILHPDRGDFGGSLPPPPPDDEFDELGSLADFGPPSPELYQNQEQGDPMTPLEADLDPDFMGSPGGGEAMNQNFAPPPMPPEMPPPDEDQDFDFGPPAQQSVDEFDGFDPPTDPQQYAPQPGELPPQMPGEYSQQDQYPPQQPGQGAFNTPDYGSYPPPQEDYNLPPQEDFPQQPMEEQQPDMEQGYSAPGPNFLSPQEQYDFSAQEMPPSAPAPVNLSDDLSDFSQERPKGDLSPTRGNDPAPEVEADPDSLADFSLPTSPIIDPESVEADVSGFQSEPIQEDQDEDYAPALPESASDPSANQLSVGSAAGQEEEESLMGGFGSQEGLEQMVRAGLPNTGLAERQESFQSPGPVGIQSTSQQEKFGGIVPPKEEKEETEGSQAYTPVSMTTFEEGPGVYGRRVASCIWMLSSALLTIAFLLLAGGEVKIASVMIGPMTLVGILMLTGARWSGWLGVLTAIVYSSGFISIPILVDVLNKPLELNGISMMPPDVAVSYFITGACFFVGSMMLLTKDPGKRRALIGSVLIVVPMALSSAWLVVASKSLQVNLNINEKDFVEQTIDDSKNGIRFLKPEGWATPNWDLLVEDSPLATGLAQKPDYFYINQDQDMLVALYWDNLPEFGLSTLLKGDQISVLEKEITRNLPADPALADTFTFKGHNFTENVYKGTVGDDTKLLVLIDKARLSDRMLLITVTQNQSSPLSQGNDPLKALNPYFSGLVITRP